MVVAWLLGALAWAGSYVTPARLAEPPQVVYPLSAGGVTGRVRVILRVDKRGEAEVVRIQSGPRAFWEATADTVEALVFVPAAKDGRPTASLL
jgi:precorrin-4 methylase